MSAALLTTKLYIPPVRPELVSRPRLTERLNAGLHRKLTLVSAPAGDWFAYTAMLFTVGMIVWVVISECGAEKKLKGFISIFRGSFHHRDINDHKVL